MQADMIITVNEYAASCELHIDFCDADIVKKHVFRLNNNCFLSQTK